MGRHEAIRPAPHVQDVLKGRTGVGILESHVAVAFLKRSQFGQKTARNARE
jgi:hypothetical protein